MMKVLCSSSKLVVSCRDKKDILEYCSQHPHTHVHLITQSHTCTYTLTYILKHYITYCVSRGLLLLLRNDDLTADQLLTRRLLQDKGCRLLRQVAVSNVEVGVPEPC